MIAEGPQTGQADGPQSDAAQGTTRDAGEPPQDEADTTAAAAAQARADAAAKIAAAKEAKKALGPDSTWEDRQAQKKLADDAKSAYGDYLMAKKKADELEQQAFAASPLGQVAEVARAKANEAKAATEAVVGTAVDAMAEPLKRWQLDAEKAARRAEADRKATEIARADARREAHVAQMEKDRLETEYAQKVADLAFNKYQGNENKAKMELTAEAAEVKKANDRLEQANNLLKAAGQGGLGGAAAGLTGKRILTDEALKETK